MYQESLVYQAQQALEWNTVLDELFKHAQSSLGAERCRTISLEIDLHGAQARQEETREMQALLQETTSFPTLSFKDCRASLALSLKGATVDGTDLRDLSILLGQCQEAKRCLEVNRAQIPHIWKVGKDLEQLSWVKKAIDQCIDAEGHIRETATPELHQLFQHAHELRRKMRHRLETILQSSRYQDSLQGHYFAQRENRYVIPVKADMQQHISGIVHDISASGATVFLEPRELIDLNNSIKVADLQTAKEVQHILQDLSNMIATHESSLSKNLELLAVLDCLGAKARLSHQMKGKSVQLNSNQHIHLKQARHPLLVLTKDRIVANDISMAENAKALIISGPNTGGKTVTLKLIGLFAFMVRAGLLLPCEEGSEMAIFPRIYADIGDTQDLTRDLSSFSAHISKIIKLLKETHSSVPSSPSDTLVLLDEIGSSTDPIEGAALAEALLNRLVELGFKVIVTTHYSSLKTLAFRKSGFHNASHEFDLKTLSPTYRLIAHLPGGSSAISIAGRLGLENNIVQEALQLINDQERSLDQVFQKLQETQSQLDEVLSQARDRHSTAEQRFQEAQETLDRIRSSELQERQKIRKQLRTEFSKAKRTIHHIVDTLQKDKTYAQGQKARAEITGLQEATRSVLEPLQTVPLSQLEEGSLVEIKTLDMRGTLLETPQGKKRVKVQVGRKELTVDTSLLLGLSPGNEQDSSKGETPDPICSPRSSPISATYAHPTPDWTPPMYAGFTLDVRGKSVEEAMEVTTAGLDQALAQGAFSVRVVHGHGSGTLKKMLRKYFHDSPYVESFKAGDGKDGGDGVTIVQLK